LVDVLTVSVHPGQSFDLGEPHRQKWPVVCQQGMALYGLLKGASGLIMK
jgi:hypothetical protein